MIIEKLIHNIFSDITKEECINLLKKNTSENSTTVFKVNDSQTTLIQPFHLLENKNEDFKEVHPVKEITDRFKVNSIY